MTYATKILIYLSNILWKGGDFFQLTAEVFSQISNVG